MAQASETAQTVRVKNVGLRGVKVADTKISFIDGEKGVLIYRGFRIEDLAARSSYPETAYLLIYGSLPTQQQLTNFNGEIAEARKLPDFIYESFKKWPKAAHPMDVLQGAVPLLAMADPDLADDSREANYRKAIRLIARLPMVIAAWQGIRNGLDPLPADPSLSHAGNFLWQFHGTKPDPESATDLDTILILHAEHTFNASTFACREVVSTRAHMYAGIAAGVAALSGSLHGGANAQVMRMLQSLEADTDVAAWVKSKLDRNERIMGMGHAVYKTEDPRAKIMKNMARRWAEKKSDEEKFFNLAIRIEQAADQEFAQRGKANIKPNADFYGAVIYHALGIPEDMMTPLFAVSRIAGWAAHVIEEKFAEAQEKPMLYRPSAEYVGEYCGVMGCTYQPPEGRA
jgi:citrate synthase